MPVLVKCPKCPREFKSYGELLAHLAINHDEGE